MEVISKLLDAYRDGAQVKNIDGALPLHDAGATLRGGTCVTLGFPLTLTERAGGNWGFLLLVIFPINARRRHDGRSEWE